VGMAPAHRRHKRNGNATGVSAAARHLALGARRYIRLRAICDASCGLPLYSLIAWRHGVKRQQLVAIAAHCAGCEDGAVCVTVIRQWAAANAVRQRVAYGRLARSSLRHRQFSYQPVTRRRDVRKRDGDAAAGGLSSAIAA